MDKSIAMLLADAQASLAGASDSPRLDAEVLLAHVLDKSRSHLRAWPERVPDDSQQRHFAALLARRSRGEPIAYLIGRREFWSLDLVITPATLIPRPETERLVELALARLPADRCLQVADLGSGSGAIALAIARERPLAAVVATDICEQALAVAEHNARRLNLSNVRFQQGDWHLALGAERYDLIAANPPYLATTDPHLGSGDVRFEPTSALVGGDDGLAAIRIIIAGAGAHLRPGGWLLLEHGHDQGEAVGSLLSTHGFTEVSDHRDASGIPRVACGRRPG